MTSFRNFAFAKNATNKFGQFKKGDRAQARFPQELVDSYLKHGILVKSPEPLELDAPVKDYTPRPKRKKAAKTDS